MKTRTLAGKRRGFSLIELMVAVAIVGFVTAAVVPSFSNTLLRNRMREAAMLVVSGVFNARSRAARTGICHRIWIRLDIFAQDGGNGGTVEVAEYRPGGVREASCSSACGNTNVNDWAVIAFKAVGDQATDSRNVMHPGTLVGDDVALDAFFDEDGNQVLGAPSNLYLYFEPWGGMRVETTSGDCDLGAGFVRVSPKLGPVRHVRISSGGEVRYTFCEDC